MTGIPVTRYKAFLIPEGRMRNKGGEEVSQVIFTVHLSWVRQW